MIKSLFAVTALTSIFPIAALADLNGMVTLSANTSLNMSTGTTASSGGDLLWDGTLLKPQGSALQYNLTSLGFAGINGFNGLNQQVLQTFLQSPFATSAPVGSLAVSNVIAVLTIAGNDAKLLVTAINGTTVTLQYTTFGVNTTPVTPPPTTPPTGPAITQVLNNYSYILPGLPNYGIAPGTLFVIQGTNLASATNAVLQNPTGSGIPLSLNGASITVTVNGVTTHPAMYYAIATQLAAVLPSATPVGSGTVTVTYNGTTSAPAPITVIASALGLDTYAGTGTGLGVATDPLTGSLFYYNQSAKPGQTIVLWGSGLGANMADSDTVQTATPHAVNVPLTIYIGGIQAQILYQGGSGYPGVNQINVTIPESVPTGCAVSLIAVSGTYSSNTITLPIDPTGAACNDPFLQGDGTQIVTLAAKNGNLRSGSLVINQVNGENAAGAVFLNSQGTIANLLATYNPFTGTSLGSCTAGFTKNLGGISFPTPAGPDAGTLTVSGPAGNAPMPSVPSASGGSSGVYGTAPLSASYIPATGGSFTFKGTGGADVGAFTASVSTPSLMNWTNVSAISSVTRSQGLNITWTGAPTGSFLIFEGSATTSAVIGAFTCTLPAALGQFTVPSYILQALPASQGYLSLANIVSLTRFTATGLDAAEAHFSTFFSINPAFN